MITISSELLFVGRSVSVGGSWTDSLSCQFKYRMATVR